MPCYHRKVRAHALKTYNPSKPRNFKHYNRFHELLVNTFCIVHVGSARLVVQITTAQWGRWAHTRAP